MRPTKRSFEEHQNTNPSSPLEKPKSPLERPQRPRSVPVVKDDKKPVKFGVK
jgi:hypothetical protein